MAQTNFTPISLYYSATAAAVPTAGNLIPGELAINTADGKLFYKDSAGVVQVIGTKGGVGSSTNTQVLYNSSGLVVGDADFTFNGTTVTMANDASISGLTVGKGGGAIVGNTALGGSALAGTNTGSENTGIGYNSLPVNTSGTRNTAIGSNAMASSTTSTDNVGVGKNALYFTTTGASNTAIGTQALQSNTTASNNTAIGYQAGYIVTGTQNVIVGSQAGSNATGSYLTAVGYQAGQNNTDATFGNDFFGYITGKANTSGANNSAFGGGSLSANTTGGSNASFGKLSLSSNTTGSSNTAVGKDALLANTTASNNTAVGFQAGYSNATGANSVMIGRQAGYSATNSAQNTFIGALAGYSSNATAGGNGYNTCVGFRAGYNLTTGYGNTFIGSNNSTGLGSGDLITTGNNHSILGAYDGNAFNLDIRTATVIRYSVISCGNGNRHLTSASGYSTALGDNAVPQAGTGITFPATQNGSSNANTLDDYEEGTWTPNVGGTATYSSQTGKYTKIGNVVTVTFDMTISTIGTGSTNNISGNPFTAVDTTAGSVTFYTSLSRAYTFISCYASGGTTIITFTGNNATATTSIAFNSDALFQSGSRILGSVTYRV
jgi:hypothetical protein